MNILLIFITTSIWLLLTINIILLISGYRFSEKIVEYKKMLPDQLKHYPKVSILIPAHNEELVIKRTLEAMVRLEYPSDSYEVIVVNDNSTDKTNQIVSRFIAQSPNSNVKQVILSGRGRGGGKSSALNEGLVHSKGEIIAVYDADNTPNPFALRYLVQNLMENDDYGAVIGKFRTRNKTRNLLTKFINIETLSFQWLAQAGRWNMFGLCTIPGTNFVIRKNLLDKLGGWDEKAIAEDTEISFRIFEMGMKIGFMPLAETYEQEPETLGNWFKQRTRWVSGNIYVLFKNLGKLKSYQVLFEVLYFFVVYVLFLGSILVSDLVLIYSFLRGVELVYPSFFNVIWALSYIIFVLQVVITLSIEKGEFNKENIILSTLMYFTYCQLWLIVSTFGLYQFVKTILLNKEIVWYKTERYES